MREYLEDISKNMPICIKELTPDCGCFKCRAERDTICNECLKHEQQEPYPKLQDKSGIKPGV